MTASRWCGGAFACAYWFGTRLVAASTREGLCVRSRGTPLLPRLLCPTWIENETEMGSARCVYRGRIGVHRTACRSRPGLLPSWALFCTSGATQVPCTKVCRSARSTVSVLVGTRHGEFHHRFPTAFGVNLNATVIDGLQA
jgi:hypothetical protein